MLPVISTVDMIDQNLGAVKMSGISLKSAGVSFTSMRVLGSYALVYLTAGSGIYQLQGQTPRPCRAGDILVVFPEIPHGYGPPPGDPWDEVYIVFDGPVFDVWRRGGLLTPEHPILHPHPRLAHIEKLREIVRLTAPAVDSAVQLKAVCALQAFMASVLVSDNRKSNHKPFPVKPTWLEEAVNKMAEHPELSLQQVARSCGLSYETFRKRFRELTGEAPARFRNRQLFLLAQKLIYEDRLSTKELADRLGFCDEFHFSKRFRQVTGQTPGAFRRSLST